MMKMILVLLLSALTSFAQGKTNTPTVEGLLLEDVNSVLSETYNESEGSAEAIAAQCKQVKATPEAITLFCTIQIKVQPSMESNYKSRISCSSMKFEVAPDLQSADLVSGWEECIENVNGVTEF